MGCSKCKEAKRKMLERILKKRLEKEGIKITPEKELEEKKKRRYLRQQRRKYKRIERELAEKTKKIT